MITNLIASIVVGLVTNVSETFPTHQVAVTCPGAVGNGFAYAVACFETQPVPNPQEKYITTSIKEVTTVSFEYGQQEHRVFMERPISSQTVTQKLEWVVK